MKDRILIVDDDQAILESMREFIGMFGYPTQAATDAETAVTMLQQNVFDVVITDIILPGMSGLELTEYIRTHYDADIIVMTGFSGDYSYEEVIHRGAGDFVFKPVRFEELFLRLKRLLRERHLKKELEKLAITDDLTGLYNSRHFYRQLELEIERSTRYAHPLALLLLDIDYFKMFNDNFGHLEGNKVLISLGRIIRSCLRKSDSAYRYGGEEFTVILPETNRMEAKNVAQRIKARVAAEKYYPKSGRPTGITVSFGITEFSPKDEPSTFINRADQAMFLSKQKGRNRITTLFAE
jgi:diguanylate cyclase (GGDEF)-like protein